MLVVGRVEELKIATTLDEANELLNEGWGLIDAKIVGLDEFALLLGWYGRPRQEIHGALDSVEKKPDALDALTDEITHRLAKNFAKCLPPRDILQRTLHKSPSSS